MRTDIVDFIRMDDSPEGSVGGERRMLDRWRDSEYHEE